MGRGGGEKEEKGEGGERGRGGGSRVCVRTAVSLGWEGETSRGGGARGRG